jgi:DNA helicase HerA-like ATPase
MKAREFWSVVEEAHTVMPEPATMGLGDFASRGLVSKIAQIALQGRKYRVGLLKSRSVPRLLGKNVLTQCNTVVALNSFDETTVGFLSNVYGRAHAETVRDFPQLHAVVFIKGVRS